MIRKISLNILFLVLCQSGWNAGVDSVAVRRIVGSFIAQTFKDSISYQVSGINKLAFESKSTMWIVNLTPEGWLLISADDKIIPVVAYSYTGKFVPEWEPGGLFHRWLEQYNAEILSAIEDKSITRHKLWDGFAPEEKSAVVDYNPVTPFIQANWDQDNTWNRFCPEDEDGPGGHVYVGCVAVSMAQAMSVYQYPVKGTGSIIYYCAPYGSIIVHLDMEDEYQWAQMSNDTADNFNSKLLYHCAASVNMSFSSTGSGSYTYKVPSALKTFYNYSRRAKEVVRYADDQEWKDLLANELAMGRPIVYSGDADDGRAGHAFNIDGVDSRGYFHLNWGWDGKYNGFFLIDNLRPGGTSDFTKNHSAVIGITPPIPGPYDLSLTNAKVKEGLPAGSFVGKVKVSDDFETNPYYFDVKGDSIGFGEYLDPDFYIENDSLKTAREFDYYETPSSSVNIFVNDTNNNIYQEKFAITILQVTAIDRHLEPNREFVIFPVPAGDKITVTSPDLPESTLIILDVAGRVWVNQELLNQTEIEINVSHFPAGVYMVKINKPGAAALVNKFLRY